MKAAVKRFYGRQLIERAIQRVHSTVRHKRVLKGPSTRFERRACICFTTPNSLFVQILTEVIHRAINSLRYKSLTAEGSGALWCHGCENLSP